MRSIRWPYVFRCPTKGQFMTSQYQAIYVCYSCHVEILNAHLNRIFWHLNIHKIIFFLLLHSGAGDPLYGLTFSDVQLKVNL